MSPFHNSLAGERLALAWHRFGTFLSFAMALLAALCSLWCALVAAFLLMIFRQVGAATMIGFLALGFILCAFVAMGGVFWHRRAEHDHQDHMQTLQTAADYVAET